MAPGFTILPQEPVPDPATTQNITQPMQLTAPVAPVAPVVPVAPVAPVESVDCYDVYVGFFRIRCHAAAIRDKVPLASNYKPGDLYIRKGYIDFWLEKDSRDALAVALKLPGTT